MVRRSCERQYSVTNLRGAADPLVVEVVDTPHGSSKTIEAAGREECSKRQSRGTCTCFAIAFELALEARLLNQRIRYAMNGRLVSTLVLDRFVFVHQRMSPTLFSLIGKCQMSKRRLWLTPL
jgi:hypothetical protein